MNEITIKQVSKEHSYIMRGDEWLASVKNEYAEIVRAAFQDNEPIKAAA